MAATYGLKRLIALRQSASSVHTAPAYIDALGPLVLWFGSLPMMTRVMPGLPATYSATDGQTFRIRAAAGACGSAVAIVMAHDPADISA